MDSIRENQPSIATRLRWATVFQGDMNWNEKEWGARILDRFPDLSPSYQEDVIRECVIVGLIDLASDLRIFKDKATDKNGYVEVFGPWSNERINPINAKIK